MQIIRLGLIALSSFATFGAVALAQDSAPDLSVFMVDVPACFASPDPQACIGQGAEGCMAGVEGGHSTQGMAQCMQAEAVAWDDLLAAEYSAALADAVRWADPEPTPLASTPVEQLTASQAAWTVFRDANCAMKYGKWGNGSMRFIAGASCMMQMTAERTIELRAYYTTEG